MKKLLLVALLFVGCDDTEHRVFPGSLLHETNRNTAVECGVEGFAFCDYDENKMYQCLGGYAKQIGPCFYFTEVMEGE